ncbi:MAG: hypothetical protein ETSY2_03480 [Candidatus Entotheonella gemina]|uniref:CopG family transcriptional regulator n=1 Tax=Candidatus Entotheonella gemina TaxID=1429439 RepID=W4MFS4_9BACT|nr:MAG: hypothetical protein ETSY2_03480 [Candidatus Entotheonella gemina]
MSRHKIVITISSDVLAHLDQWAARKNQSRSCFITGQLERRLQELEDENVTQLYDEAYRDERSLQDNQKLTREMGQLAPRDNGDEGW